MTKNQIRVQYSGFIIFTAQILSVITGLVFTLLLTRNMSTDQYGKWTNIFDYTGYFMLFSGMIPFWATRFVARGKEGVIKTSTLANLIIAVVSVAIYLPVIVPITNAIGTQAYLLVYLIAGLYIFNFYLITNFESCLRSIKPQAIGYGLLIQEVVKVAIALIFIVGFGQLFLGAMLALTISGLVQALYYTRLLAAEFKQRAKWSYLKEWFKGSTVIVYSAVGAQLLSFVFILLFFYGGSNTRAYYQAAFTFANIIMYSASLAFALYPKLLAKSCSENLVGESFKTVLMLAIPLSAITIVMSTSFLTVLNVAYSVAWPVLIMLTFDTLVVMVSQFYSACLMGAEALDEEGKIPLRQLLKSKIFKVFSLQYIQAAIALPLVYFVLTQMTLVGSVEAVVYVIAINIGVHVSTFVGLYWFMRNSARIPVAWVSIAKYVLASLIAAVALYLLPYPSTLFLTIAKTALGMAFYIGLLLVIDKQARNLVRLILDEVKITIGSFFPQKTHADDSSV